MVTNQIYEEISQAGQIALPAYENTLSILNKSTINKSEIQRITTISRGSSSCATEFLAELLVNSSISTRAVDPSLFYQVQKPQVIHNELVIALSQSGETGEVVNALKYASKLTSNTLAIHNSKNSSLSSSAFWDVFLDAGIEKSVPATKSVIAQIASCIAIYDWLTTSVNRAEIETFENYLISVLDKAEAEVLDPLKVHAVLGTNEAIPIAKEIALKMTELWGVPIWGGNALEFLHGPIAITRESNSLIYIGDLNNPILTPLKDKVIQRNLNLMNEPYNSNKISNLLLSLSYWQKVAATSAISIGVDPANPFGLSKVTQT